MHADCVNPGLPFLLYFSDSGDQVLISDGARMRKSFENEAESWYSETNPGTPAVAANETFDL